MFKVNNKNTFSSVSIVDLKLVNVNWAIEHTKETNLDDFKIF